MKKNVLFALCILLAAAALALPRLFARGGASASVRVLDGAPFALALDTDGRYEVEGARLPVTLEVSDGRVRFVDSRCPDHICEGYGWLSRAGDQAVCLPAGVVISVE